MKEYFEKFADIVEKLHILYRILIGIGLIILFSMVYIFLFIMPQFDEIEQLHKKNNTLQDQLTRSMIKARELGRYQKMAEDAEKRFDNERRVLPESEEIRRLLENVARLKQESGLTFTLFRPEKEVAKDFYAEIPISMKLTGHFHNVGVFFDKISKLSRLVHIQNFKIASADSEDDISLIEVSCKAVTYKFIQK
ncbi:MAG: type 4a pilus biogenesis protein PilO [Candidatus Magnetomorum sp.]|nr:type 4a pilus biogenesis protein PilO [Candidatus Magnetomorum sp.]